jgi:hypothetical protein
VTFGLFSSDDDFSLLSDWLDVTLVSVCWLDVTLVSVCWFAAALG